MDDIEEGAQPVDFMQLPRQCGYKVIKAEAVDMHL
jgi:hypothetical protein